jgi:hypothetical protein
MLLTFVRIVAAVVDQIVGFRQWNAFRIGTSILGYVVASIDGAASGRGGVCRK